MELLVEANGLIKILLQLDLFFLAVNQLLLELPDDRLHLLKLVAHMVTFLLLLSHLG